MVAPAGQGAQVDAAWDEVLIQHLCLPPPTSPTPTHTPFRRPRLLPVAVVRERREEKTGERLKRGYERGDERLKSGLKTRQSISQNGICKAQIIYIYIYIRSKHLT